MTEDNMIEKFNRWVSVFAGTEYIDKDPQYLLERLKISDAIEKFAVEIFNQTPPSKRKQEEDVEFHFIRKEVLETPLWKLGLCNRLYNSLRRNAEIKDLGELIEYSSNDLLKLRNFGRKGLLEVQKKLAERGLKLRE